MFNTLSKNGYQNRFGVLRGTTARQGVVGPLIGLALFSGGCGSGGGTVTTNAALIGAVPAATVPAATPTAAAPQGNAAFRAAALATDQALNGGISYPFAIVKLTLPTQSALSRATSRRGRQAVTSQATAPTYNAALNLYASDPVIAGNTATVNYFTDAAGTQSAGAFTMTQVGVSTFLTDYPAFPATIKGTINLTAGNIPCTGSVTLIYSDNSGTNTLTGHLDLPKNAISIDIAFTLSNSGNVGGTAVIKENNQTITVSNISGPLFSTLQCSVDVAPYGWKGTGAFSLLDGTFSMNVSTPQGTDTAATDASGSLKVAYADKTTDVVNAPLLAALFGTSTSNMGNTGNTGNTGGTGNTGNTGSTGGGTGSAGYNAPVVLELPLGYDNAQRPLAETNGNIALAWAVNTNHTYTLAWTSATSAAAALPPLPNDSTGAPDAGTVAFAGNATQIVGGSGDSFYQCRPTVWTGANYAPQMLQNSSPYGVATAINATGQIVGVGGNTYARNAITFISGLGSEGDAHALYWSRADAPVTVLTPLVPNGFAGAVSINSNGQIVGHAYDATGTLVPVYWSSPTASPLALALPPGATSATVVGIDNAGHIAGTSATGTNPYTQVFVPLFWSSPTDTAPAALPLPTGATGGTVQGIGGAGLVVGFVSLPSGGIHGVVWKNNQVEDLNDTFPPLPANSRPTIIQSAQSINDQGEILARGVGNNGNTVFYFILTPK